MAQVFDSSVGKQYLLTLSATNLSTYRAPAVPYQTLDGAWRMRFNIYASVSVATSNVSITITGVTFKSGMQQACSAVGNNGGSVGWYAAANGGASTITWASNATGTEIIISGDVELNAKPSFVA